MFIAGSEMLTSGAKESCSLLPGTDVTIFKNIFDEKLSEKIGVLTENKDKLCENLIITLVFKKKRQFFAENCPIRRKLGS
jgi:hypothetical protein